MARKRVPADFKFGKSLGQGSFSNVLYATEIINNSCFAVKILDKKQIIREKKVKYVDIEKKVLNETNHPLIIKLFYTFQDQNCLYFVLELAENGDLLSVLKKLHVFDKTAACFYTGQLALALEYLHSKGILHRDVKPENILLDHKMHIKITDFGCARILSQTCQNDQQIEDQNALNNNLHCKKSSFVGTAEYCSPELLNDRETSDKSDIWALGVVLFQLLSGRHPFRGGSEYLTFQKILNLEYSFPLNFDLETRSVLKFLLNLDPQKRGSINDLKSHSYYREIDWDSLTLIDAPSLKENLNSEISTVKTIILSEDESLQESLQDISSKEDHYEILKSFINHTANIVKSGVLQTRIQLKVAFRGLILLKDSFKVIDLDKKIIEAEFHFREVLDCVAVDDSRFYILMQDGVLFLLDGDGASSQWVECICSML